MSFGADIVELVRESLNPLHAAAQWWTRAPLANVAQVLNGYPFDSKHFNDSSGHRLIRIRDVTSGDTSTFYSGAVPKGYWVSRGDIVVGMDGDFNLRVWDSDPSLLNQRVCKLIPDTRVLDPTFLAYVLPGYLRLINENTPSVTVRHLSSRTLQQVPIPLPPLPEQRRIVARIEALFARTRRARADLERIAPLAKRYREAATENAYDADIEAGWAIKSAGELAEIKSGITLGKKHGADVELIERPYLRVANVQRGHIKLDQVKTIHVRPAEAERLALRRGDVLMNEGGDLDKLGRGWVWEEEIAGCIHQNHVFRLRLRDNAVTPYFLSRYANQFGARYFLDEGKQTTNLASISMAKVAALPVPVPPPDVAAAIDALLGKVELASQAAEREASRALALLDRLEQSILTRAFRGELVPQDPNDEAGSVLLERIKAGREAEGEKPTSGRGRKPNGSEEQLMTDKPLPPRDRLLKDSEKWPTTGLPFEAIAMRNFMPHDTLRDALFELLSGPSAALQQRFDTDAEVMVIQRVAA